jgi:hypothetical protein
MIWMYSYDYIKNNVNVCIHNTRSLKKVEVKDVQSWLFTK